MERWPKPLLEEIIRRPLRPDASLVPTPPPAVLRRHGASEALRPIVVAAFRLGVYVLRVGDLLPVMDRALLDRLMPPVDRLAPDDLVVDPNRLEEVVERGWLKFLEENERLGVRDTLERRVDEDGLGREERETEERVGGREIVERDRVVDRFGVLLGER